MAKDIRITDTLYYMLLALLEPIHGYAIMARVKDLSLGEMVIGPATLYTSLQKMVDSGYIEQLSEDAAGKKVYQITSQGRRVLDADFIKREQMAKVGEALLNGGTA